ncbi:MAG: hypothetical protein LKF62_06515 [Solobacterium sp.]|nr:hypothetical protein [Solobacterium sp.]
MELKLFDFIEDTMKEYEIRKPTYSYAEGVIRSYFTSIVDNTDNSIIGVHTRIKSTDSLKEKLLRNKFYLHFKTPDEALDHLSDLIGITIECRFIRNETEIYQTLFRHFETASKGYCRSVENKDIYLNLHMSQPQLQRNGFTIFRIDGTYLFNGQKINFELQIKSLVHRFWSEIEHEVVYKNPDFVVYDRFMKNMLGAVRDNLDVVDHQLEIIYNEISNGSRNTQIGFNADGFKMMTAASINELVNQNMKSSMGFSTDFKKSSAILSQYIYIRDFMNGENNEVKMVDYLEHLNYLASQSIDFKSPLKLEQPFAASDPFCSILGAYWQNIMNVDFEWHVFFAMLFAIQPGDNAEDFTDFIHVVKLLLIQNGWYQDRFTSYGTKHAQEVRDFYETALANALVEVDTVEIIHEDHMIEVMNCFHRTIEKTESDYPTYTEFNKRKEDLEQALTHEIVQLFRH